MKAIRNKFKSIFKDGKVRRRRISFNFHYRSSKLRSNTNRGPSSGNGPGGTDIEGLSEIRGRSMNQTHQLQMTQYGLLSNNTLNNNQSTGQASNLPKIQNLQTARHKSKDK